MPTCLSPIDATGLTHWASWTNLTEANIYFLTDIAANSTKLSKKSTKRSEESSILHVGVNQTSKA